jgi:hypothetical protein
MHRLARPHHPADLVRVPRGATTFPAAPPCGVGTSDRDVFDS